MRDIHTSRCHCITHVTPHYTRHSLRHPEGTLGVFPLWELLLLHVQEKNNCKHPDLQTSLLLLLDMYGSWVFPGSALVFSYYLLLLKGVFLHPFFILSSPAVKRKDISGLSVNRLLFYFYSPSFISTAAEKVSCLFQRVVWNRLSFPNFFFLCATCAQVHLKKKKIIYIYFFLSTAKIPEPTCLILMDVLFLLDKMLRD